MTCVLSTKKYFERICDKDHASTVWQEMQFHAIVMTQFSDNIAFSGYILPNMAISWTILAITNMKCCSPLVMFIFFQASIL